MIAVHAYRQPRGKDLNSLVILTQFVSVYTFKLNNPSYQFHLYTDNYTLTLYTNLGLDKIYDVINVDVLENYPSDRISHTFWASPKLWVMKHINEPFVMMDTDLVWHGKVENYSYYSFSYLHRESPSSYPYPHRIQTNESWVWDYDLKDAFNQTFPINCSLLVFNDIRFLKKYVDVYFQFVLDNDGGMLISEDDSYFIHASGAQTTIEQWLLAAFEYLENKRGNKITSYSILDLLAFTDHLQHYNFNKNKKDLHTELKSEVYHLWGAKSFYEKGMYDEYAETSGELTMAAFNILRLTGNTSHRYIVDNIVKLIKSRD